MFHGMLASAPVGTMTTAPSPEPRPQRRDDLGGKHVGLVPDRLPDHLREPGRQPPSGQRVEVGDQTQGRLGGCLEIAEPDQARGSPAQHNRVHPAVAGQDADQALIG